MCPFPRVSSRRPRGQQRISAARSARPCERQSRAVVCAPGGVAVTRTHCTASASVCQFAQFQRARARILAFPRVGHAVSSAFPPRARPGGVSGSRWHSFAPLVVSLRLVLTALPLHPSANSHSFSGYEPVSSRFLASATRSAALFDVALAFSILDTIESTHLHPG